MKNKVIIILLFVATFSISATSDQWERTFNGRLAQTFTRTRANKYILAGSRYGSMLMTWDIIQTDLSGNTRWDTTFVYGGGGSPSWIEATPDSGYIVVGNNSNVGWYMRFNKYNKQVKQKTVGTDISSIAKTEDNGFIMIGLPNLTVTKIDNSDNTLWSHSYAGYNLTGSIVKAQPADSGYYCTAYNGSDMSLLKLDINGNLKWSKSYSSGYIPTCPLINTTDSCLLLACGSSFLKVDRNGKLLWKKTYGLDYFFYSCNSLAPTSDDGFITSNNLQIYYTGSSQNTFMSVMKLNKDGDSIFTIKRDGLYSNKVIQDTESKNYILLASDYYSSRLINTDSIGSVITGNKDIMGSNKGISFYPNPFNDKLNISTDSENQDYASGIISIYDQSGRLILYKSLDLGISIDTQYLPQGCYIVKFKNKNKTYISKAIKTSSISGKGLKNLPKLQ